MYLNGLYSFIQSYEKCLINKTTLTLTVTVKQLTNITVRLGVTTYIISRHVFLLKLTNYYYDALA